MKLYITRHGKTVWNIESRFQGVKDSCLVEEGIRDAKDLRNRIYDLPFAKVLTSPLGRAKQTTEIVFENRDINIEIDQRISEMSFGVFEGMKTQDIFLEYGELYDNLWNHPEKFTRCPGGGESFEDVKKRIESFVNDLKQYDENQNVFIVTHGMFFICLLGYFLGYDPIDFPKINRSVVRGGSITIVEILNDTFNVLCVGDDSHLTKEDAFSYVIKQK